VTTKSAVPDHVSEPAARQIPYGRQNVNEADIAAVVEVLRSDFLTQGPVVPRFEEAVIAACGAAFGVACSNATAALHLACRALGVGRGDRVWTSAITFVASANCALYCGADADFVDIDPRTYNMSVDDLAEKLRAAERSGTLPKVVIPVHLCGQPSEMERIHALGHQYGFKIIEDASHAIGGRYCERPIGDCRYSDITVFSFHPVKIITTAEGGMAVTNDSELAHRMSLLRSHGITRDSSRMTQPPEGPWYYEQVDLGYNYRMTEVQAALGLNQMGRLHELVAERHAIARRYDRAFEGFPLVTPWQDPRHYSGLHLYVIRLKLEQIQPSHRMVFESLRQAGIGANLHYIPVYRQPYYRKLGFRPGYCPEAERYYSEAISLPLFPGLTREDQQLVIDVLWKACRE